MVFTLYRFLNVTIGAARTFYKGVHRAQFKHSFVFKIKHEYVDMLFLSHVKKQMIWVIYNMKTDL